jgi:mannose-6-phosphate isomerase-like protein (cupin superfamily)
MALTPIRRIVTGVDDQGRSKVVSDGVSPGEHESEVPNKGHIDFWVWRETPLPLAGKEDPATWDDEFPGPVGGGHLRVVNWLARASDPSQIPPRTPLHDPEVAHGGRAWDRGGGNNFDRTAMHKTQSVDYGILLAGERTLVLDDCELMIQPGDIVVQVGAWHLWDSARVGCLMAFDMISADFVDGPAGTAQGNDPVMQPRAVHQLPPNVKTQRRIVTIDREPGRSSLVADGPSPDVRLDPARPGFALQRMWVVDSSPAKIVFETLHLPHVLEPPAGGSVLNVMTFPPDSAWQGNVGAPEVAGWFDAVGSSAASTYAANAPHPYMQRTRTVDFCIVLEGELVLVLDTEEAAVEAGQIVVQRGTNHAWSNRSQAPAVVAIASHDAR